MQGGQNFHPRKLYSPIAYDVGSYARIPVAPTADATPRLGPGMGPIPSPSKGPKNFIIFDQTDNKCQIMFYPGSANKFNYPEFNIRPTCPLEKDKSKEDESNESSSFKEDTKDIDALLSLSEGEDAEDDEEVSTGRTMGNSGGISPDSSWSTDGSKSCKTRLSTIHSSPCSSNSSSGRKRQKMKKLIKALRSIVPGGDQMDSAAVLDESVRYLKSLKMEVKKLGIGNLKHK